MLKLFREDAIFDGNFIKPEKYTVYTSKPIKDFRAISLADMHFHCNRSYLKVLADLNISLKSLSPNYIFVTGDGIDSLNRENVEPYLEQLEAMTKIAPVYYTIDRHDLQSLYCGQEVIVKEDIYSFFNELRKLANVKTFFPNDKSENGCCILQDNVCLVGNSLSVDIENDQFAYEYTPGDQQKNLKLLRDYLEALNLYKEYFSILMYHNPELFYRNGQLIDLLKEANIYIDLILSGHMHDCMLWDNSFLRKIMGKRGFAGPGPDLHLFHHNISGIQEENGVKSVVGKALIKAPCAAGSLYGINKLYRANHIDVIDVKRI